MSKKIFDYLELIILFNHYKNNVDFIDKLNIVISEHNDIYKYLSIKNKIDLASKTGISLIKNKTYKSFEELRNNIILFPPDKKRKLDNFELFIMIILRCGLVYEYINSDIYNNYFQNEYESFIYTIKKIDNYIETFTYDDIFSIPDFFLKLNDINIIEYVNDPTENKLIRISKNDDNNKNNKGLIFEHEIFNNERIKSNDLDEFAQKKIFYDFNTEFISKDVIFTDNKQNLIFKFQYLISNFFNKFIKMYIDKNNLFQDDIVFIFKGGTFMKILFEKYKYLLKFNENFIDNNKKYFQRSDSDYSLYINPKFNKSEYTNHYYFMNVLTYNILNKIKFFIDNNLDEMLPINKIDNLSLKLHLDKINDFFKNNKNKLPFFKDIEEFIGISICNNNYFNEIIPDKPNVEMLSINKKINQINYLSSSRYISFLNDYGEFDDFNDINNFDDFDDINNEIDLNYSKSKNKMNFFKTNKYIGVERNSFYITPVQINNIKTFYPGLFNISAPEQINKSGLFQYYNETNRFKTDAIRSHLKKLNYFILHRIKINIILYYKKKNTFGFFSSPSELIDIPIVSYGDFKKKIYFPETIEKYINTNNKVNLLFNSYTLNGVIDDLINSVFAELEMPWDIIKFDKKIFRLSFFYMIYFNNLYTNIDIIKEKLNIFLDNFDMIMATNFDFIKYDKTKNIDDRLYLKLIDNINQLKIRVDKNNTTENINNFKKFIEIFKTNIKLFNQELVNNIYANIDGNNYERIPFLKKYIKYTNA